MPKKKKTAAAKSREKEPTLLPHLLKVLAATIILIAFVMLAGLAVIVLFPAQKSADKTAAPPAKKSALASGPIFEIYPKETKPSRPRPDSGKTAVSAPRTGPKPRIAIIIDDVGYEKEIVHRLMALKAPLTLSILPHSPFNKEIASAAHQAGFDVMLHLPMEPMEYPDVDPGPGVLLTGMPPDTLLRQLEENIADVPHIKGVNNHMGSKLTAESTRLYQIFSVLKKQNLFFIDSRTTEKSLCRPSAGKLQVPFAERDVFLDNTLSEADIKNQLDLLVDIAGSRGKAIGIAHPHEKTWLALQACLPLIEEQAELVPASALVEVADQ